MFNCAIIFHFPGWTDVHQVDIAMSQLINQKRTACIFRGITRIGKIFIGIKEKVTGGFIVFKFVENKACESVKYLLI